MSTCVIALRHTHRTIVISIVLLILGGFVLFEVGIRLLTPDAVRYDVEVSNNGGPAITRTATITDPRMIARWRSAVTATPSGRLLIGTVIAQWQKQVGCAPLSYATASYEFLWHGIVVESISSLPVCTEEYMTSSGGLPDPRTYIIPLLVQP